MASLVQARWHLVTGIPRCPNLKESPIKKLTLATETLAQLSEQESLRVQGAIATGVINGCDPSHYRGCTQWAGCPNTQQLACGGTGA